MSQSRLGLKSWQRNPKKELKKESLAGIQQRDGEWKEVRANGMGSNVNNPMSV